MDEKEFDTLAKASIEQIKNADIPDDERNGLLKIVEAAKEAHDNTIVQTVLQAKIAAAQDTIDILCKSVIKLHERVLKLEDEVEVLKMKVETNCNDMATLYEHATELELELDTIKQQRMEELTFDLQAANSERKLRERIAELNNDFAKNRILKGE